MTLRVVVAGGGTAGHIEPALNTADALLDIDPQAVITAVGTPKGLESVLVPQRGYELDLIPAAPFPRSVDANAVGFPKRLATAIRAARQILRERNADVVVGFGGYAALPVYLAAARRVPIVVHEANAKAGLANKVGARVTSHVAETYAGSLAGAHLVGMPLRAAIATLDRPALRDEARGFFGLPPDGPVVLAFGGSQGARRLNEAVVGAAAQLSAAGVGILHAAGRNNSDQHIGLGVPGAVSVSYIDRMDLAYAAADVVVCRAGAMTVAELCAVGLPAVYVPLPIGNGEQRRNAAGVIEAGGGLMIDDDRLTGELLASTLVPLAADPRRLADMAGAAAAQGRPDAAEEMARMVLTAAGEANRGEQ